MTSATGDDSSCQELVDARDQCIFKHGDSPLTKERCLIAIFKARRCLAFEHCSENALPYYKTVRDKELVKGKGLCASYDEYQGFGNPRLMEIDASDTEETDVYTKEVFRHHVRARGLVLGSHKKVRECKILSEHLGRCFRKNQMNEDGTHKR